jgi:tRNA G26 N,N-dimethylase Trm1
MAGPIWNGKLHDKSFIELVQAELQSLSDNFGTLDRIEGMLEVCKEVFFTCVHVRYLNNRSLRIRSTSH